MAENIFPTALFPPVEYFVKLVQSPKVIIDSNEFFQKQSFRNRYEIAGPNSRQAMTACVTKANRPKTKVKDVKLSYTEDWQTKHWRSIITAYNTSPFFLYYMDDIEMFFKKEYPFLIDMNRESLNTLCEIIGIETEIKYAEKYIEESEPEFDFRNYFNPKKNNYQNPEYTQVFEQVHGFMPNLSILDLLFNQGPDTLYYLETTLQR
ncbi:MAG: WbqC family protein [Bacteroidales bacterium]|nr:WbqC family protein [Bacteroidales bacterium]